MEFADFHFIRPLWLLALIPLGVLLWLMARRKVGACSWETVVDTNLLPYVLMSKTGQDRSWPLYMIGLSGVLGICALAGPSWERLPQPVFKETSALVIVLDLSRSMDATDISPNRLARARFKIADILSQRKEGQTALVVYAGQAFTVTPLTDDTATISSQLGALTTDLMPSQGSRADLAINQAGELLKQAGLTRGELLVVADGVSETHTIEVVKRQARDGYRTSVLGMGSVEGSPIPLEGGGFLKDANGDIVVPKLDESQLLRLAHAGGGIYRSVRVDDGDISDLLTFAGPEPLQAKATETGLQADVWREEGPWLLLLVLPLAALAFRRGYLATLLLLLVPLPQPGHAIDWSSLWSRPDQQASRALNEGRAEQAAELFTNPAWKAAAQYRAHQYEQALQSLDGLTSAEAAYNRGNALARLGRYPEAIEAYDEALKLKPEFEDARYNRDLVKQQLQEQQQPSPRDGNNQEPRDASQQRQGAESESSPREEQGRDSSQEQATDSEGDTQDHAANPERGEPAEARSPSDPAGQAEQSDQQQNEMEGSPPEASEREKADASEQDSLKPFDESSEQQANDRARASAQPEPWDESQQATEQWLRRIPDDPGGLLRRKFLYQYREQNQAHIDESEPW